MLICRCKLDAHLFCHYRTTSHLLIVVFVLNLSLEGKEVFKLIIVDDEKSTREGLKDYISWNELNVDCVAIAEDGQKAFQLASELKPDILLTDIVMPQMNGIELANGVKEILPECKIIFLSGHTDKEYLKSAINLQAISYIEKPVDLDEVQETIKKTVEICQQELSKKKLEHKLKSTVKENLTLLKEKLALELISIHNNIAPILDKMHYIKTCSPLEDTFISIVISFKFKENDNNLNTFQFRTSLHDEVIKLLNSYNINVISGFKDEHHLILHVYSPEIIKSYILENAFNALMEELNLLFNKTLQIFISIGKNVKGVKDVYLSYSNAVFTLQRKFFTGYNNISIYCENSSRQYNFNSQKLKDFEQMLMKDSNYNAISYIKGLTSSIKSCENTLVNNIKSFYLKLATTIISTAQALSINVYDYDSDSIWEDISSIDTLYELEGYVCNLIGQFYKEKNERQTNGSAVYNIIQYIQANYMNESLSIKDISEYTYLTPNYLCLIFKKEMNKTINQYITEVRIDKAKELLKDRKFKLYEIAYNIGYGDSNYFAKIFKKFTGLNPSEYREKYLI